MLKPAGIKEIKKELERQNPKTLEDICLRLAGYKKENKELLSYILFWSEDEREFIREIKSDISKMLDSINLQHMHWAKKTVRKTARYIQRFTKYSKSISTEIELRIYFCEELLKLNLDWDKSKVLVNIFRGQTDKIDKLLKLLHEDLQYDYQTEVSRIKNGFNAQLDK